METLSLLPYLNTDLESYAIEHALLTFERKNLFDFKYLTENLTETERITFFMHRQKHGFSEK